MQLDNKKSSVNICLVLFGIGVSLCASCAESYFIMEKLDGVPMDKMEFYYGDYLKSRQHVPYIALYDAGAVTDAIAPMVGNFDVVTTITAAGNSSANAIHTAIRMIQTRYADIVVVGGTDALTRYHINGFSALGMLSHEVCRPFDARHNGLNVGEGAAYLVLENDI